MGATLIEEIDVQFAPNTEEAEFHEEVAKNVLGATYIGELRSYRVGMFVLMILVVGAETVRLRRVICGVS